MQKLSDIKNIHFIGIGGISLSALAKLMLLYGKNVTGSDMNYSSLIMDLMEIGIDVWIGSKPEFINKCDLAVYSSAIADDDAELVYCRNNNIDTIERHLFLAKLARDFHNTIAISGTHGKTTACAMLCYIFKIANKKFCGHIGGDVLSLSNLIYTGNEYLITEACEYKKGFLTLPAKIALVLNAEIDHPDTYSNTEELYSTFDEFLFYDNRKLAIVCSDTEYYNQHIKKLNKSVITYGEDCNSDFLISNIREYKNGYYSFSLSYKNQSLFNLKMNIPGKFNIYNAVAGIAISHMLHIDKPAIKKAIESFPGVKRRFERKGLVKGATIYHDYAHHPSEIKAVIKMAKQLTKGRLIVVFQPHTFSRTAALFENFLSAFNNCNEIYLVKEFSAREEKSQGKSAYDLFAHIHNKNAYYYEDILSLAKHLIQHISSFDTILVLGAGNIHKICELLI